MPPRSSCLRALVSRSGWRRLRGSRAIRAPTRSRRPRLTQPLRAGANSPTSGAPRRQTLLAVSWSSRWSGTRLVDISYSDPSPASGAKDRQCLWRGLYRRQSRQALSGQRLRQIVPRGSAQTVETASRRVREGVAGVRGKRANRPNQRQSLGRGEQSGGRQQRARRASSPSASRTNNCGGRPKTPRGSTCRKS